MGTIASVLAGKGREVHTVSRETTVYEAIQKMVAHNLGSVLVTEGDALCGIFTERDYLRRIALEGRSSRTTPIHEVMVSKLIYVAPTTGIEEGLAIMTQQRIRHLPVMEEGKLAGIVSIGDLVKHQSREQKIEIHYLKEYITGGYPG